ncbi:DMT family transporter [Paenibacillus sp. JX-17]|uniref:DMT family transporter n=1 Tax=Paenibacillus lacisoli TaxID=3064525 RepID=A0ABT9CHI0_9BACL|nr:DMT family transporter [Paenibacillus sp. JX-17]MDO7908033.1 DMT family transporter [Paenibacillus sp. JX-17]
MWMGAILAVIAGSLVSLQNIFNSKVNEKTGSWTTTTLVLGLGFAASLIISLLVEGPKAFQLNHVKPWYWISGVIGIGVVMSLVKGVRLLGPTFAISVVLTSQLGFALLWDSLGLLGLEKVPFTWQKLTGVLILLAGVFVFKFGGSLRSKWKWKKTQVSQHEGY